jgi:hypothetical protein
MNGIDYSHLKPGMRVIYHGWKGAPGKEYIVRSEPWQLGHGEWVVLLEGKSGGVSVDFISDIMEGQA